LEPEFLGVTREAATQWLSTHGYHAPLESAFPFHQRIPVPSDAGRRTSFVKHLLSWLPSDGIGLLHVTTWGVWPSNENMDLFSRVRATLGENRPLHEAPGQIMPLSERATLECILGICVYFLWDAIFADDQHRFLFRSSHDEFIEIACSEALAGCARETIDAFST
jgi:hypothetical protein